jgi:hypothetical protein
VLTLPYGPRSLLAWDHGLTRAVLAVHARALLEYYRRQANNHGIRDGHTGTLTVIQRFGGGLNLSVHFHTLVFDGVFSRVLGGELAFVPGGAPSDAEVAHVLDTIQRRVSCGAGVWSRGTRALGQKTRSPRRPWRWPGSWALPSRGAWPGRPSRGARTPAGR